MQRVGTHVGKERAALATDGGLDLLIFVKKIEARNGPNLPCPFFRIDVQLVDRFPAEREPFLDQGVLVQIFVATNVAVQIQFLDQFLFFLETDLSPEDVALGGLSGFGDGVRIKVYLKELGIRELGKSLQSNRLPLGPPKCI